MKGKSFLVGFFIGGAAVGISTLLTVPDSGKNTLMNMKTNTDNWIKQFSEVKDRITELQKTLISSSLEGKIAIIKFISDVKIIISDWKQEIHPHQQELQKELQEIEVSIQELESNIHNKVDKNTK
jgi:gas vesicle protein